MVCKRHSGACFGRGALDLLVVAHMSSMCGTGNTLGYGNAPIGKVGQVLGCLAITRNLPLNLRLDHLVLLHLALVLPLPVQLHLS